MPVGLQEKINEARQRLVARDFPRALEQYSKLTRQCPNQPALWAEYGNAAAGSGDLTSAELAWQKARDLAPHDSELLAMIGHQYQAVRKPEQARAFFLSSAAANPRGINPRMALAVLLEKAHDLSGARALVNECLAIDPKDDQARYFRAVLNRRENNLTQAESELRDLIASDPRHPYVRYACRYELAQILDRADRCEEAMDLLLEAKRIVAALTDTSLLLNGYDQTAERASRFTALQPKNVLQLWASYFPPRKRDPIPPLAFLGGHPRSGTTLLEQVLDAHPQIAAFDEPPAFIDVLQPAFHKTNEHSSARLNVLRRLYLDALRRESGPTSPDKLLLDKNPSPTARLPVWLRVFPELRVLIALRDPRDIVLSCYFQNIPLNPANVNFLSFERIAKHYQDLIDIWLVVKEWEGFTWLETRYEDVVADLQKEGRRVTEFLGLSWDENQARFYESSRKKQLYSPTYQDVTRPVYTRSIARWRLYEKHLAPILPTLEPYCRKFGYE